MRGIRARRRYTWRKIVSRLTKQNRERLGPPPPGMKKPTIDHIVSKHQGFNLGIAPERIGSLENLRWMEWDANAEKGVAPDDESRRLIEKWRTS